MAKALAILALVLAATGAHAASSALPEQTVPSSLGVNIHFTGNQEQHVEQIAQAGFKWIRMDVIWQHVEKEKGKYDFQPYDELLDSLDKHGIRALFILCYGNPHYNNNLSPSTDESRRAFVAFAKAAAARYKGRGVIWEIWNEPNITPFWKPVANVEDYLKLARATSAALRQADPGCTIVGPALSSGDFEYLEKAFKIGLLDCVDAVSLHPYGCPIPEAASEYYNTVRKLVKQYAPKGKDLQLLSGEWGYSAVSSTSVDMQGYYLPRMFLTNLMNGVRLSIWYDWINDGLNPAETEHNYGIRYNDFTPKPAYLAAQTMMHELAGYSYITRLYTDSDDDYLLLFGGGDDYRLAAWTTKNPHKIKIPIDVDKLEAVSHTGERSALESRKGMLELDLTTGPKYIEPQARSKRWAIEASWKTNAVAVLKDGITAKINSQMNYAGKGGKISISGSGIKNASVDVEAKDSAGEPGQHFKPAVETKMVGTGGPVSKATVTIELADFDQPFVQIVEVDTSVCPLVEFLPPVGRELLFKVIRPENGPLGEFKGSLEVGNSDGLRLISTKTDFTIPSGKQEMIVRLKMDQEPAGLFSFSYKITDGAGNDVVRVPARQYSMLEAFTGKIGERVSKYSLDMDGDPKVPGEAKLVYVKSPDGGPGEICARLDYDFGQGWKFARISPRPMLPIQAKPKSVKIWIKSDGIYNSAALRVMDSGDQTFQHYFGRLNFSDWRCIESKMDGSGAGFWGGKNDGVLRYPTSWDSIFILDKGSNDPRKGTIYLGPMMMCYE